MKTCKFIGLNHKESQVVDELCHEGSILDGYNILFIGFDTTVEEIHGMFVEFFDELILLYSGSSEVSKYFDTKGIKYNRITRYCDDAVITHQIQKVIELTEGKRDLNQLNYLSWGKGHIANKFKMMFPNFAYTMIDPNRDNISDLKMSKLCSDIDVILINHSHHKFNIDWILGNKNQFCEENSTIIINSSRRGAIQEPIRPMALTRFYSDVDGPHAPHLFFESDDTYNNIKNFIRIKVK